MDEKRSKFLTTMVGILNRLEQTSQNHGEPLLAGMLAIARAEAEDSLRHGGAVEALAAQRARRSSRHSWRACDQALEDAVAEAVKPEGEKIAA